MAATIKTIDSRRQLALNDLQLHSKNVSVNNADSLRIFSSDVTAIARSFNLHSGAITGNSNWQVIDGSINLPHISLLNKRRSGQTDTIELNTIHLSNLSINKKDIADPVNYFTANPSATFSNANLSYKND